MRKRNIFWLVLIPLLAIQVDFVRAQTNISPQNNSLIVEKLQSSVTHLGPECYGKSDYPHLSSHVPGTVNVVSRTVCPGRFVTVRVVLYRKGRLFLRHVSASFETGTGLAQTNASLVCTWKDGMKRVHYWFTATHQASGTYMGVTRGEVDLPC